MVNPQCGIETASESIEASACLFGLESASVRIVIMGALEFLFQVVHGSFEGRIRVVVSALICNLAALTSIARPLAVALQYHTAKMVSGY